MTNLFNFYPKNNSATVLDIPASQVAGAPDAFGCIETTDGLYVPTMTVGNIALPDWNDFSHVDNVFGED